MPRKDEFQGEYVAAYAERLKWLTGFGGSAGLAIVTLKKAAIFVDGRYTIQVRQQVDDEAVHPSPPDRGAARLLDRQNLKKGDRLGFDPWLVTADQAKRFREACDGVGAEFVAVTRTPSMPCGTISPHAPRPRSSPSPRNSPGARRPKKSRTSAAGLKAMTPWC